MPTGQNPIEQPKTAPLRRRLLAMLYDGLLLLAILMCIGMLYSAIVLFISEPSPEFLNAREGDVVTDIEPVDLGWPILPILIGTYALFYIYFWRKSGQTLGMRAWKIKLVNEDFQPPTLGQCLLRLASGTVSLLLLGLGYWIMLFNRDKGTFHDRVSSTKVVLKISP